MSTGILPFQVVSRISGRAGPNEAILELFYEWSMVQKGKQRTERYRCEGKAREPTAVSSWLAAMGCWLVTVGPTAGFRF